MNDMPFRRSRADLDRILMEKIHQAEEERHIDIGVESMLSREEFGDHAILGLESFYVAESKAAVLSDEIAEGAGGRDRLLALGAYRTFIDMQAKIASSERSPHVTLNPDWRRDLQDAAVFLDDIRGRGYAVGFISERDQDQIRAHLAQDMRSDLEKKTAISHFRKNLGESLKIDIHDPFERQNPDLLRPGSISEPQVSTTDRDSSVEAPRMTKDGKRIFRMVGTEHMTREQMQDLRRTMRKEADEMLAWAVGIREKFHDMSLENKKNLRPEMRFEEEEELVLKR